MSHISLLAWVGLVLLGGGIVLLLGWLYIVLRGSVYPAPPDDFPGHDEQ